MASASRLQSGSYRVQVTKTIDGKKVKRSFCVSPDDYAGDWRKAKAQAELMARNWQMNAENELHRITVRKAMEDYNAKRVNSISPSTMAKYVRMHTYFPDEFLDMDIKDVTQEIMQGMADRFAGLGLSKKTTKNQISYATSAIKAKGIEKNLSVTIQDTVLPNLMPPERAGFQRLLTLASPELKLAIVLSGLYTLRRGEIGGLIGEDILWDFNRIAVRTSKVRTPKNKWYRKDLPKNSQSRRVIDVDPEIMKLIPKVEPKEYIISLSPDQITQRFCRLRKKAGVTCRFHDLRKYAASLRSDLKMPGKYIEADGGWRPNSSVMRDIYDKPFQEKRHKYSKQFNKKILKDYGNELFGN